LFVVPERTGVLVIRIWAEGDQAPTLRARITKTLDLTQPDEVSTVASSADEIESVVHVWLSEFERSLQTGAC
jgi:hypothetical protein